jgi:hypothetical protein
MAALRERAPNVLRRCRAKAGEEGRGNVAIGTASSKESQNLELPATDKVARVRGAGCLQCLQGLTHRRVE